MSYLFLCLLWLVVASAQESLTDPKTLVSSNAVFELGFFSPNGTTNRYVGIWYNQRGSGGKLEVVWVANREMSLNDNSGVLKISEDGNLEVVNGEKKRFWSSNVPAYESRNSVFRLEDTGNLVLLSNVSGEVVWRSFDHPTDVFLPDMSFTIDGTLTEKQALFRSWKSPVDPSGGNFTVGVKSRTPPQVLLWDGDRPLWRNGPWNGNLFVGLNSVLSIVVNGGKIYFGFSVANNSAGLLHFVVNYNGSLVERDWNTGTRKWETVWNYRQSECDVYGKCGAFGSCKATNSPICGCLRGFVPSSNAEWSKGNWTSGCVRRSLLHCGAAGVSADGFWKMASVKVPDDAEWLSVATEDDCHYQCLEECSCVAYAYFSSIGCMTWNGSLIDIEELADSKGIDLFVRLASSELGNSNQHQKHHSSLSGKSRSWIIIVTVVVSITVSILGIMWLHRQYGMRKTQKAKILLRGDKNDDEFGDLPIFKLEKLVTATNNFHESNKLGRGGFGTVYKGKLDDGEEIAVKRLSKVSGQGLSEFMTEVLVISKLQHRNLVRLLGCCVEGEEKLLVYEYMPNKSLDALLFDRLHQELLGWKTRFSIIQGISRGILYLHRDSRLRIIHRDLKASNILLDDKLSPKISDFGMAKIFGGNEDQADTNRVVGTYGYMSPEYAMAGRFSEKSDVFSFGVLLLEIVSGRRNSSFKDEESLSLIAHAWKLWNGDDIESLIDPVISGSGFLDEILRCIQVALLCVQELPEDRPNISMVISMIDSEVANLPNPTQPGFTQSSLKDPETLISSNGNFKLGFFGPSNSRNRYLGIWFNDEKDSDKVREIIWVANRDRPVNDSSAVLRILDDGNLQVSDEQNQIYWSSNVISNINNTVAQLLDTGNLVLVPKGGNVGIWQSFEHPTDSLLPGIKLTFDKSVNDTKTKIQSWKSSTDPSSGRFRFVSLPRDLPEFFIVDGDKPYWRSGPWNGYLFLGVPYFHSEAATGFNVDDHNDTVDLSYDLANQDESFVERFVLTYDGLVVHKLSNDSGVNWEIDFQSLETECDVYGKCGSFAVCNPRKEPICECLKGFKPRRLDEWSIGNWTNGCVRMTDLQCNTSGNGADKFLQLKKIKVPDFSHWILAGPDNCQKNCLDNCSCLAYSYYSGVGCMLWSTSMIDLQQFSDDGADLFVRLASSELPDESSRRKIIITVAVILSALVAIISVFCLWKWIRHKNGKRVTATDREAQWQNIFGLTGRSNDFQDMPVFEFTKLVAATNNFSDINKLGQGGFGQVYKGKCEDGQEVAVKRLSRASGQGLEEFMNEVVIISKLQHKNLVRLLGCCVEGEEKLLVYELLPNKSLDAFLFDPQLQKVLDWQKRFSIIKGICRGLLYLHRDSRLRIIHRDLKPSNILLDEELNPKISDFGMARIFGTKQYQASTLRVVGTYGYMSPEYAMEGRFSEKSDVFSFGVLLLEIVSGRRNNKILDDESLNLLTYAWKLWNENDMLPLIDPAILDQCSEGQIFKCIQIGLLCVQEYPADRPDVPALISVLDVDDAKTLPIPKQPGFTRNKGFSSNDIATYGHEDYSANGVSLTTVSGR